MATKCIVYMDSCCFIDVVKQSVGTLPTERDADVWFVKKLLEAHRKGDVAVFTSVLSIAECVAVEKGQATVPDEVQNHFRDLLTNGQYVTLAQPTIRTGRIARDLRWTHNLVLGGPDAIHVATALEVNAVEMLTSDDRLKSGKMAAAAQGLSGKIKIVPARESNCLPADYRQGQMI